MKAKAVTAAPDDPGGRDCNQIIQNSAGDVAMIAKTVSARTATALAAGLLSLCPAGVEGNLTPVQSRPVSPPQADVGRIRAAPAVAKLSFEANLGQTDERVKFLARGQGYFVFLAPGKAVLQWPTTGKPREAQGESASLQISLLGANPAATITGGAASSALVNYFLGQDSRQWRTRVPTFGQVRCAQVYPGIDLVYYGQEGQLEYDFTVAPGTDPGQIRLGISGADQVALQDGDLVIRVKGAELRHHRPRVYQVIAGIRREIDGAFVLRDKSSAGVAGAKDLRTGWAAVNGRAPVAEPIQVGFRVGSYEATQPLVIDPKLSFATYLGGSADDRAYGVAVDRAGNVYVAGQTSSLDFPSANPLQPAKSGAYDVFVTKFTADGSAVVYSTFLGGNANDCAFHIASEESGSVLVAGITHSTNFPTVKPHQAAYGGGDGDGFVAKLNPDGASLVYATYLGGSGSDEIASVKVDAAGNAYVAGDSSSTNFPTVKAFQSENHGGFDAVVAKLTPDGQLLYSTYLGGSGRYDRAVDCDVDAGGNVYVTGYTSSLDFPLVKPLQPKYAGGYEVFVSKLNATGSGLEYSTFLGGSGNDMGRSIAVDRAGNAYVSGDTFSTNFPVVNAFQSSNAGKRDVFIAKLNPAGSALVYSTYLGGTGEELGCLAVDSTGSVCLVGVTSSTNFPTVNALQPAFGGGAWDAFIARLSPAGTNLTYASFAGGTGDDEASAITVDNAGSIYIAGTTTSGDFPATKAFQGHHRGGGHDAFVMKITDLAPGVETTAAKTTTPAVAAEATVPNPPPKPTPSGTKPGPPVEVTPAPAPTRVETTNRSREAVASNLPPTAVKPATPEVAVTTPQQPPRETVEPKPPPPVTNEPAVTMPASAKPAPAEAPATNVVKAVANEVAVTVPAPVKPTPTETPTPKPVPAETNLPPVTPPPVTTPTVPTPPPSAVTETPTATNVAKAPTNTVSATPDLTTTNAAGVTNQPAMSKEIAPVEAKVLEGLLLGTNLIVNGDAEAGPAAPRSYATVTIPGWTVTNKMTVLHYGIPGGFPSTNDISPADPGQNLFVGGPDDAYSVATQTVDLSGIRSLVEAGQVGYTLSGYLGGSSGQRDNAALLAIFKDANDTALGQAAIGPVMPKDRDYHTRLVERTTTGTLPAGTRKVEIRLEMTREDGAYNDAFADNLSFILRSTK